MIEPVTLEFVERKLDELREEYKGSTGATRRIILARARCLEIVKKRIKKRGPLA